MKLELPSRELLESALYASANATTKIVFLVLIGVVATANGVFNDQGVSDLGRLVYHVTLPALLFVNIISEVTVARLLVLWKLPAMALVHVTSGFLLAKFLNSFFGIRGIANKAVTLSLMFGNVGSLAIAIIDTLCMGEPLASEVGKSCALKGVEYISFYLIAQNILMFTWAEEIVKDHTGEEEEEDEDGEFLMAEEEEDEDEEVEEGGIGTFVEGAELDGEEAESPAYTTPVTIPGEGGQAAQQQPQQVGVTSPSSIDRPPAGPASILSTSRRKGSFVRFHDDATLPITATATATTDGAHAHPHAHATGGGDRPHRRSRVSSSSSLHDGLSLGRGGSNDSQPGINLPRLKHIGSQASMLDQEDIHSILSRYPVESRPRLETDSSLLSTSSSSNLAALSPALFRRRGSRADLDRSWHNDSGERDHLLPLGGAQVRRRSGSFGAGLGLGGGGGGGGGGGYQAISVATSSRPAVVAKSTSLPSTGPPLSIPQPSAAALQIANKAAMAEADEESQISTADGGGDSCLVTCFNHALDGADAFLQLMSRLFANPSIRAALIAFFLGIIPPIKDLFVPSEARPNPPLGAFLGAMQILGQAQVPCSMLMLSGSGTIRYLNDRAAKNDATPSSHVFSPKAVSAIILGRILIFPVIGLLWWWAGFELGLFANTPVLSLVVLLDAAVPTAQNVVMLILVHGKPEHGHALAYVILWQYALCIPVLILNVTVSLAIIRTVYPL